MLGGCLVVPCGALGCLCRGKTWEGGLVGDALFLIESGRVCVVELSGPDVGAEGSEPRERSLGRKEKYLDTSSISRRVLAEACRYLGTTWIHASYLIVRPSASRA